MNRILWYLIVLSSCLFASKSRAQMPKWSEEDLAHVRRIFLKEFVRSPQSLNAPLVEESNVVVPELLRVFPADPVTSEKRTTVVSSSRQTTVHFRVPVSETADGRIEARGRVQVTAYESLNKAEYEFVTRLATLPVTFRPGTFSGRPVGEAAAVYRTESRNPTMYFLRRNVVVIVQYRSPIEVPYRSDPPQSRVIRASFPDPAVADKCEALARTIDQALML